METNHEIKSNRNSFLLVSDVDVGESIPFLMKS